MATYPYVKVNFRLVSAAATPLKFANIEAELAPKVTNSIFLNTLLPEKIKTQTNQYGLASLILSANDSLEMPGTKYLITISHSGNSYYFLIELTQDTPETVDFENLLDRKALTELQKCKSAKEGEYKISGNKLYI